MSGGQTSQSKVPAISRFILVNNDICNDIITRVATVITINRADVVALVEEAAARLTDGNKTEAIALGMRRLLDQEARTGSLFGAHPGSVKVRKGVDLTAPVLADELDAETGRELER